MSLFLLVVALAVLLVAVPAAEAARPHPGSHLAVHDHGGQGRDWHIELDVSSTGRSVRQLVLYPLGCGATGLATALRVGADGALSVVRQADGVRWRVAGRFTAPRRFEGTYELTRGACATGRRAFIATDTLTAARAARVTAAASGRATTTVPPSPTSRPQPPPSVPRRRGCIAAPSVRPVALRATASPGRPGSPACRVTGGAR
jgi:hypothetical protein